MKSLSISLRKFFVEKFYREDVSRIISELESTASYSKDQLMRLQTTRLQKILQHSYKHSSFYKLKFDRAGVKPNDLRSLNDIHKFPQLSKEELRSNFKTIAYYQKNSRHRFSHSSGTMGKPIIVLRDRYADSYCQAIRMRNLGWYSIDLYDRQIRMWGYPLNKMDAFKNRIRDRMIGRKRISPFSISKLSVPSIVSTIRQYKPTYIYGWLSGIFGLSRTMKELNIDGQDINLKAIITTSEVLYDYQRKIIEEVFRCKVINEYGCSESGILAFECPNGGLHIMSEHILLEFVNNGRKAELGEPAEILITDLKNYSMPLIRYKIGDVGRYLDGPCSCGSNLPLMEMHDGRILDTVVSLKGTLVHGGIFCYAGFEIISKYGGIKDFRIIQRKDKNIDMILSKDIGYSDVILTHFREIFEKYIGNIDVNFRFVEHIPTEVGKQKFVISEIENLPYK